MIRHVSSRGFAPIRRNSRKKGEPHAVHHHQRGQARRVRPEGADAARASRIPQGAGRGAARGRSLPRRAGPHDRLPVHRRDDLGGRGARLRGGRSLRQGRPVRLDDHSQMALGRQGAGEGLTMRHWLLKSEPGAWSWDDQVAAGAEGTHWNGVRNHAAKLNMIAMKRGDLAFFYHSNEGKAVVGVVEVIKEHYPDPEAAPGEPWVWVDVKAVAPFQTPVTLDVAKKTPALAEMALVKFTRLSVQPVRPEEWDLVCTMGGYAR